MRDADGGSTGGLQPLDQLYGLAIERFKIPVDGGFLSVDHETTPLGITIGRVRGDPEIHIDGCFVGVGGDATETSVVFERPQLPKGVLGEQFGHGLLKLMGNLQQQAVGKTVFERKRTEVGGYFDLLLAKNRNKYTQFRYMHFTFFVMSINGGI